MSSSMVCLSAVMGKRLLSRKDGFHIHIVLWKGAMRNRTRPTSLDTPQSRTIAADQSSGRRRHGRGGQTSGTYRVAVSFKGITFDRLGVERAPRSNVTLPYPTPASPASSAPHSRPPDAIQRSSSQCFALTGMVGGRTGRDGRRSPGARRARSGVWSRRSVSRSLVTSCHGRDAGIPVESVRGQPSFATNLCDSATYLSVHRLPCSSGNASITSETTGGSPVRRSVIPGWGGQPRYKGHPVTNFFIQAVNTGRIGNLGKEGGTKHSLPRSRLRVHSTLPVDLPRGQPPFATLFVTYGQPSIAT